MWAPETIRAMNGEYGDKAREEGIQPYILDDATEIDIWPPFPFPAMGDECDELDLEPVASLFCDSSGFGHPDEAALTVEQLKERIHELFNEHGPLAIAIGEQGQFQLYVEVWKA